MHRLLERQLKAATSGKEDVDLTHLLELVSRAYEESDRDRKRTDRSITLMIEELDVATTELREHQNRRFEAAVSNMSHGLIMCDSENRLVICNEPYAQLYRLPKRLTEPGTSFWEIWEHRERHDMIEVEPPLAMRQRDGDMLRQREAFTKSVHLRNNQVVRMHFQPLEDGGWLATTEDITERYRAEETIRFLARHDSLTGLANRLTFREAMEVAEGKIAAGESMAVMCIDLDKFKPINDTQGHLAGDKVLKAVGERVSREIGPLGVTSRLGGDEFAALIGPFADESILERLAQQVIKAVTAPVDIDGFEVRVGVSVGIAVAPRDGSQSEALMRNADLALYRAKANKRNSYCFFERTMDEHRRRRQSIEAGLRQALEDKGLVLHYQPLLSADRQNIICCEALMRWQRPGEGLISPAEFIPIAEETGQIRDIGRWALFEACKAASKWRDDVRIAVNVSPIQFKGNELVEQVGQALSAFGLAPERLELEITESLFLADDAHNLEILHQLRALGVRIALDDFGTGYSSLSYLRMFPFDKIKIDRSFILNITEQADSQAIIQAIMQLGRALGMDTTAEGIETEEQLELVKNQGCAAVQGYLFSPPLPESAIGTLLSKTGNVVQLRKAS